ncbi:MAG: hypothetical protein ACR2NM_09715 [Bythopirellula sp.]
MRTVFFAPDFPVTRQHRASVNVPLLAGLVVVCFGLGYLLLGPLAPQSDEVAFQPFHQPEADSLAMPSNLVLPAKSLTPVEVVETQMQALASYHDQRSAIHQVFALASPANQAVTGPITRFEQMILGEHYRPMVDGIHWMAGRAVQRDRLATVLVTTIDEQGRVCLYRFYLSMQPETFQDCWMTDRVTRLFSEQLPGDQPLPKSAPAKVAAVESS